MENSKTKNPNAKGDFLGKLIMPYMVIASVVAFISFVRHWEESNILFNLIMSSVAGFFWPVYALIALFN